MFILLVKVVLFIMHMWIPLISVIINVIVIALWCFSVYGQAGPDHSDPEHPSSIAWYITKSCSFAAPSGNKHNCEMAKASFAVSIFMVYVSQLSLTFLQLTNLQGYFWTERCAGHMVYVPNKGNEGGKEESQGSTVDTVS